VLTIRVPDRRTYKAIMFIFLYRIMLEKSILCFSEFEPSSMALFENFSAIKNKKCNKLELC